MKKLLSLVAVASTCLTTNAYGCLGADSRDYAVLGKLQLVGNQLSDKNGNPVQLKGWSTYSINSNDVEGCLGENQWELMKKYGANIVRLVFYVDENNSYKNDPDKYKNLVKNSIKELAKKNMYCLIDWQKSDPTVTNYTFNPNDYLKEAMDFFSDISEFCFENEYNHVLYEICGEPNCGWKNIKSYAERIIPKIIANQPDAIVVVGTDNWSQKIMEPVMNLISSEYKRNVMYSFCYDACNHYSLLGDFRNVQKIIPVFVSEWTAMKFNGEGPFCTENADQLIADCENQDYAPQVVSWCVGNWGKKDRTTSFFVGSCAEGNESQSLDQNGFRKYGEYVLDLMGYCKTPDPEKPVKKCPDVYNTIPSTPANLWHWDYYNCGGEGVAYHDGNASAYEKDADGVIIGYSNKGEEVDVFSLAKEMQWLDYPCPWVTVKDGKVVDWDESVNTTWQDENGKPTYKSLNAARMYVGPYETLRPDEGVDLPYANLKGTAYENLGYTNLGWVEEGEWISYTVNVEKPGYYKISGIISSEYISPTTEGEISITSSYGNHLRSKDNLIDTDAITKFGFPVTTKCDDESVDIKETWNCWTISDARSGREKEVLCAFPVAGEQTINIAFSENAGGVGPLIFEFYQELEPEDPFVCCGGGVHTGINTISATKSSLWHWDYFNAGGEGVAYHDGNASAYEKDADGVIIGYSNKGEEVDVFSLAKEMQWLDYPCPWVTVKDGKVVDWDESVNTTWQDENGKPTYKSLNAARMYVGPYETLRPDEGVDLPYANLKGTAYENLGYTNLGWVEEGEWISYTVNVEKPGYYKISGIVNSEYWGPTTEGEISITSSRGNHLRGKDDLMDPNAITSFGFPVTTKCDDESVDSRETWNCWTISDARSGRKKEVFCAFPVAGEQTINIAFSENAGGVGPLIFDFYQDLEPEDPFACCGGGSQTSVNTIPSTKSSLWHWEYYDEGGEGVAYHDLNTSAYEKDADGVILGYSNKGDEVDVFSLAKEMQWLNESCPWATVKDGKVVAWDESINTTWQDENKKPTYKSLNGARAYVGPYETLRPDEGVDLPYANLKGTDYENLVYSNLGWIEKGEWINYTVNVEKPGYYKISGIISSEYMSPTDDGEISIVSSRGNLLRSKDNLIDPDAISKFGFPKTTKCDDKSVTTEVPWNCWTISDAKSGSENEVMCVFPEAGEQKITIVFNENAGGVGPLIFEWYADFDMTDPICTCGDPTAVNDIDATKFSINPNPTSGEFTIILADNIEASVEVVNMAGQVVVSKNIVKSATINKALTAGVYSVVVKSNGGVSTQKLVVK